MKDFSIFNGFGITPTKNFTAAGYDFYIPKITNEDEVINEVFDAFKRSFKLSIEKLQELYNYISLSIESKYGSDYIYDGSILNILHLFLGLNTDLTSKTELEIDEFIENRLVFDKNKVPGIIIHNNDYVFFNSGIKTKLCEGTAGVFFNKSGKGNQGFDIRACVVDEDYTDYVHLSLAYNKIIKSSILYCGDKLSQMLILNIVPTQVKEVDEKTFNELHKNSERGNNGFGSSDVKH